MPATIYTKKWTRDIFQFARRNAAMYKTRKTRTENGMSGTRGMGKCYIPRNIAKHFGNVLKHSGECRQTFGGMLPNIPENVAKAFNFQVVKTKSEKLLS